MLDRIVDLAQVLGGAPLPERAPVAAPPRAGAASRVAPPSASSPAPSAAQTKAPASPEPAGPAGMAGTVGASLEAVQAAWTGIVAEVRAGSRFLGEALAATTPTALELPWLTVALAEPNPLFAERLQAQAAAVEGVLATALGQPMRLRVTEAAPADGAPTKPRKLSESGLKADRLRGFRAKDPALDTAADALDLEIVD
jgi:hypothetical protein